MTAIEILIQARAEVDAGWCKHVMEDSRGRVCAVGALQRVRCDSHREYLNAKSRLLAALPEDAMAVEVFNDRSWTEKADVLALYDRAIAAAVPVGDPAHVFQVAA